MWAIGVGQIVRTLRDTVETQKGRQRHPLSDAISSGSGTALQIVPDSMTDAANRDPRCRFHHTHVFSFALSNAFDPSAPAGAPISEWDSSVVLRPGSLGKPLGPPRTPFHKL
jgi:hypothetical protein